MVWRSFGGGSEMSRACVEGICPRPQGELAPSGAAAAPTWPELCRLGQRGHARARGRGREASGRAAPAAD
eukprot:2630943-Alexandrium_andersonii.AAC.1